MKGRCWVGVEETFNFSRKKWKTASFLHHSELSFLNSTKRSFSQSFPDKVLMKTMPTSNRKSSEVAVNDEDLGLGVVLPPSSSPPNDASNLHSVLSEELEQESDKHSELESKLITASAEGGDAHEMPVKKVSHVYAL